MAGDIAGQPERWEADVYRAGQRVGIRITPTREALTQELEQWYGRSGEGGDLSRLRTDTHEAIPLGGWDSQETIVFLQSRSRPQRNCGKGRTTIDPIASLCVSYVRWTLSPEPIQLFQYGTLTAIAHFSGRVPTSGVNAIVCSTSERNETIGYRTLNYDGSLIRKDGWIKIPLWWVTILVLAYPGFRYLRQAYLIWFRSSSGCCLACGYDLTGNSSGVCPECGTPIGSPAAVSSEQTPHG